MDEDNVDQWYTLQSMRATATTSEGNRATTHPLNSRSDSNVDWYPLDGMGVNQATHRQASATTLSVPSLGQIVSSAERRSNIPIDFISPDKHDDDDGDSINTNSLFGSLRNKSKGNNTMSPPSISTRLNLQDSVDGEISDSRNTSGTTTTKSSSNTTTKSSTVDISSLRLTDNVSGNNTSLLLQEAKNQETFMAMNITGDSVKRHLDDQEWVNMTPSHMQDVNRPEPLGGTDHGSLAVATSVTTPAPTQVTGRIITAPKQSTVQDYFTGQQIMTFSSSGSQENASLDAPILSPGSSKHTITSTDNIPELSYTQSSGNYDKHSSYPVGPHQDGSNRTTDDHFYSSLTLRSSATIESDSGGITKHSDETPVTKLLGPAYKQTENFLKDLKKMKLSYRTNTRDLVTDDSSVLNTTGTSRDECCQVGSSQLKYVNVPLIENGQEYSYELVEQDIASASLLDLDTGALQDSGTLVENRFSDDRSSDGELLVSELSLSPRGISNKTAQRSLEPIKEVLSPDRKGVASVPRQYLSTTSSMEPSAVSSNSPKYNLQEFYASSKAESVTFASPSENSSFQSGSISSTSTPRDTQFSAVVGLSTKIAHPPRGIYDIRDSTSPESLNRKRVNAGKSPKHKTEFENHNPSEVYVSDDSKLTTSETSLGLTNGDRFVSARTPSKRVPRSIDRHYNMIQDVAKQLQGIGNIEKPVKESVGKNTIKGKLGEGGTDSSDQNHVDSITPPRQPNHVKGVPRLSSSIENSNKTSPSYIDTTASLLDSGDSATPISSRSEKTNEVALQTSSYDDQHSAEDLRVNSVIHLPHSGHLRKPLKKERRLANKMESELKSQPVHTNNILTKSVPEDSLRSPGSEYNTGKPTDRKDTNTISPTVGRGKLPPFIKITSPSSRDEKFTKNLTTQVTRAYPKLNKREENKTFRSSSLNALWDSFQKSYQDASKEKSPMMKKLEAVSNLLEASKKRASFRFPHTSDSNVSTTDSYCESHASFLSHKDKRNIDRTSSLEHLNNNKNMKPIFSNGVTNNVCPLCQRHEFGANFPTSPLVSDVNAPLTLQTWTQTSPYIIDTELMTRTRNTSREKKSESRVPPSVTRKETFTITHAQRIRSTDEKSPKRRRGRKDNESTGGTAKKDVPYTAWFQSIRSDISEVIPLSNVPTLNSLCSDSRQTKVHKDTRKNNNTSLGNLQDAFQKHKQRFIRRSRQRLQHVKDARLQEKHGDRMRVHIKSKVKPNSWFISAEHKKNKTPRENIREKVKEKLLEDSPRFIQRVEERKMADLKSNRLKMKQYDLKNRRRFLERRSKTSAHRPHVVVIRH